MTDECWRQIEQLYHAVLGHTPETCAAFLDDTCAGDEQLQTASRYEAATEFWPQYLRGLAFLKLGRGA